MRFAIACLTCLLCIDGAWALEPVAKVLAVDGEVEIGRSDGKTRPASAGRTVYDGERLVVPDDGGIALRMRSGKLFRVTGSLPEGKVRSVTSKGIEPSDGVKTISTTGRQRELMVAGIDRLPTDGVGGVRVLRAANGPKPPAVSPVSGSRVAAERPLFSWASAGSDARYRVEVYRSRNELWSQETSETEVEYGGEPLDPDRKYDWTVAVLAPDGPRRLFRASFTTVTDEEVQRAADWRAMSETEEPALVAVAGYNLAALELYDEAIATFERLVELSDENADAYAALADLYAAAGRDEDAAKARARAEELGAYDAKREAETESKRTE